MSSVIIFTFIIEDIVNVQLSKLLFVTLRNINSNNGLAC